MTYPTKYTRQYDYVSYQNANPTRPLPGDRINADLNAAQIASKETIDFLSRVMRSDGVLANGSVGYDQLSSALQTAGLAPAVPWLTATSYPLGASVIINGGMYRALAAHTSGVFADDLAATKWQLIASVITGSVGAPTVSIGLTAVEGTASTAMRSDAAPALDQTILPTWTGLHTHDNAIQFVGNYAAAGPSLFSNANKLTIAGGTSGTQFNNQASNAALLNLSDTGDFTQNLGKYKHVSSGPASWPTQTSLHANHEVNVNGFPNNNRIGAGAVGVVEAITGAVRVPSDSAANTGGIGAAGYAQTASTTGGAIGLYGQAGALATGAQVWSINTIVTNSPGATSGANTGYDGVTAYGAEIDVNWNKLPGGIQPTSALVQALLITGGCQAGSRPPGGGFYGTVVTPANAFDGLTKWNVAHWVQRGASDVAMLIGASGFTGVSQGSQPMQFQSINGAGTALISQILSDAGGNIQFSPGAVGAGFVFTAGGFTTNATINDVGIYAQQTTQSTSTATGALRSAGGLGIVKDAYIGGKINVASGLEFANTAAKTTTQANLDYPMILGGFAKGVSLASAGDTPIAISFPTSKYRILGVVAVNAGTVASLTTAQIAFYSSTGGGGTNVVPVTALTSITANAANTSGNFVNIGANSAAWNFATLQARCTTIQAAGAAVDLYVYIQALP